MLALKKITFGFQPQIITVAIILAGIFSYLCREFPVTLFEFLETIEYKTNDARFRFRGTIPTGNNVVIAAIDEQSLYAEGKWPWPRGKIAKLIQKAADAGAKVIAFDVGFFEKDDTRVIATLNKIKENLSLDKKETDYLNNLQKNSDNDSILANAIKRAKIKVVLGYYFNIEKNKKLFLNEDDLSIQKKNLSSSQHQLVASASLEAEKNAPFLTAASPETNIELLSDSAEKSGFFNMVADSDAIVRSMPVIIRYDELLYAPLSLKALSAWVDSPIAVKIGEAGNVEKITIGDYKLPADRKGRIWINYRGEARTNSFPHIPVTEILNDKADKKLLKNKIVIVGATAQGLFDLRATPFGNDFPGCEIHANIIDSILSKDLLCQPPFYEFWNVFIIILAGVVLGVILPLTGALFGILAYTVSMTLYLTLCQTLFSRFGIMLSMVYPMAVLTLIYISITVFRYLSESKKKKFINDAFSTYLAPSIVKQLIKSPEKLNLGGEDREITAFFSDVQGFTSISEKLSPNELVDLLNEFLTEMTDIILKYEGTVDKFEGDAIIAFFGAPNALENHAKISCQACIEMQKRLKELNENWALEGKPELLMRIGLCSGIAVVGNMGSKNRMDYTMMGDVVNTAARLEGVNKQYGSYTMISDSTKNLAGPDINSREIDTIYLVGKNEAVTIYELTPPVEEIDENQALSLQYYAKGLKLYKKKDWQQAIKYFTKAGEIFPQDGPSQIMAKRCKALINKPPDKNWNGVFRIATK